jgi:hypothetical protein
MYSLRMPRSWRNASLLFLLAPFAPACGSDPSPSDDPSPFTPSSTGRRPPYGEPQGSGAKPNRSTYAKACTTNADCVLVSFAEAPCDTCKCPNYAIAVDDQRKFFDEEQAFRQTCTEPAKPCLADCAPLAARCVERQCTVVATGSPPVREDASAPTEDAGTD